MAVVTVMSVCCASVFAAPDHGTSDTWVSEDELETSIPSDYSIDPDTQGKAYEMAADEYFPKDRLQEVRITIPEQNLNYLLQNALDKPFVMTESVSIGGTSVGYAGLRTKGDYTLFHSYTDHAGSDRFSFSVNFSEYVNDDTFGENQNFFGVRKLSFNNFFFDKSMLKEYAAWLIISEMGLPAPRFCLTRLYINDEYYGVYFMQENLDYQILERYTGLKKSALKGYLYKIEGSDLIYEDLLEDMSPLYGGDEEEREEMADMLPVVMEWVKNLNLLSRGRDLSDRPIEDDETYVAELEGIMDTDEVVKYFAVHSFLCQTDSIFVNRKNMGFYIDKNGRAMFLPWDYDLAFGGYYPGDAESTSAYDIDVMYRTSDYTLAGGRFMRPAEVYKSFPLFNVIYRSPSLMERYHSYIEDCAVIAAMGGYCKANGKIYPGSYISGMIDGIYDKVYEAASEPTTDHVYYMNNIKQPYAVKAAVKNLKLAITMRSLGVYYQLHDMKERVSGSGCNMEFLGLGTSGMYSNRGRLTNVTAEGLFFTADYRPDDFAAPAPKITLRPKEATDEEVISIAAEAGCEPEDVICYGVFNAAKPLGDYTLSMILRSGTECPAIYAVYEDSVECPEITVKDNMLFCVIKPPKSIAVCYVHSDKKSHEEVTAAVQTEPVDTVKPEENDETELLRCTLTGLAALFALFVIYELWLRTLRKKKS